MKISAEEFAAAGFAYLGRSYEEMDCQAFVERCMADCGLRMNLPGSNSWYRECGRKGWTGTPEECVQRFGSVPRGALLFIMEPVSGRTPGKFRNDGIGDATHMGIKTGRGKGAIHSGKSRGRVAESEFHDRTIPNGGWNRVGLLNVFDYESAKEETTMNATIHSENGKPVNLRKQPAGDLLDRMPCGAEVEILQSGDEWSRVGWGKRTGWVKNDYLIADESGIPAEPEMTETGMTETGMTDDGPERTGETDDVGDAYEAYALLAEIYSALKDLCGKIESMVGRG